MSRSLRFSALCAILALAAVSSFAQNGPLVGTVIDIDEGRNRLQIESDAQTGSRLTIEADAISTVYQGFGTVISGKPEIFTGSAGLSNIRLGDRVEIRGTIKSQDVYRADQVTLLGRTVAASPVGVGQTRTPTSVSTPVDDRATGSTDVTRSLEGTIRQINLNEGRIVIQTAQRTILNVRTTRNTPVYYRGDRYNVSNLELGDRIRVEADPRSAQTDEITARTIEVTASAQDAGGNTSTNGSVVTIVSGRVTRVNTDVDEIYVDDGRNGEIRVDMRQASDANRAQVTSRDVRAGDSVEISGSYNRAGDTFLASTVRFGADTPTRASDIGYRTDDNRLSVVSITGTVTEALEDASTLGFRDRDNNRVVRIWVTDSFAARTKAGAYVRADTLRVNDTAVIEAFRDGAGNLIAQSIRLRNR
jgi:hypothetical protein